MFILDTRETDLIKYFETSTEKSIKQLPVADIWIGLDTDEKIKEGGLIIERKSIRDLEASILDGRYREQRGRILSFCQENKTQPLYILEGYLSSKWWGVPSYLNKSLKYYNIPVLEPYRSPILLYNFDEYTSSSNIITLKNYGLSSSSLNGIVNNINYSMSNISSVFNRTLINLGAGTYPYYFWAYGNGTNNNYNNTIWRLNKSKKQRNKNKHQAIYPFQ
jgi:hypothetical protein